MAALRSRARQRDLTFGSPATWSGQKVPFRDQRTPIGTLAAGDDVTLVVRPNAIVLADVANQVERVNEAERANGALRGVVRRSWFVGPQHDYEVVVDGQPLAVVEHDPIGRPPRPVGSEVRLEILTDAIAVVQA